MRMSPRFLSVVISPVVLLSGCASIPKDAGFGYVRQAVRERTGQEVHWNRGTPEGEAVAAAAGKLLREELTAEKAVQLALLNNRRLQATYEDLGVAQAALIQAGLLKNPLLESSARVAQGARGPAFEFRLIEDFLDIFFIPLRRRLAAAELESAKLKVTAEVMDLAAEVRTAFYHLQADQQVREMQQTVLQAVEASYQMAGCLHEAGNITGLDLANERALYEQAKLDLAASEAAVLESREKLNTLMGLWGEDTRWRTVARLEGLPDGELDLEHLETRAVERSLDLAIARRQVEAQARRMGITKARSPFPEVGSGADAQRELDGEWSVGPAVTLPMPIFDRGQAAVSAAEAELQRAWQEFTAMAVEVRSAARAARHRLLAARQRAFYYREVIVPLRQRITEETQLEYNAMLVGVFQLLQAKQQEVESGRQSIKALRDYWVARAQLEQILNGRLPGPNSFRTAGGSRPAHSPTSTRRDGH